MVKMYSNGITIEVLPSDVALYKRAGYVVVDESAPVKPPRQDEPKGEPEPKKATKK